MKGQLIVSARAGLPQSALDRVIAGHGGKATRIGGSGLYLVTLPPTASESAVAAQLARHPALKFAELDRLVPIASITNDPYLGSQWHVAKIGAPQAWDSAAGAAITIAVLDTGADASHPDLAPQIVPGWNFYDNNSNTTDVHGHGTATAGAAAAAMNNSIGVAGVAGMAKIMPIRVTDSTGYASFSAIAQGLTWAADRGARVANISIWGAPSSSSIISAAQYMKNKGGLVVVAAGNDGVDPGWAPTSSMVVVSATDSADARTSWSNFGSYVALSAPGLSIYTTKMGGSYSSWWGTSFSSPVTAGVAALVMSANPSLTPTDVEQAMFTTALDLGTAGRDTLYGYGRVNAAGAVAAAMTMTSSRDVQAPSVAIAAPLGSSTVGGLVAVDVSAADNVGVSKVELRVNGALVATDTVSPYGFSVDSTKLANGGATLEATAYDAAGNAAKSAPVNVSVYNAPPVVAPDSTPPVLTLSNPLDGSVVKGSVAIAASASDDAGAAAVTMSLYIDGALVRTATGGSLSFTWNTRKAASGAHAIQVTARDAAGNTSSRSVTVAK